MEVIYNLQYSARDENTRNTVLDLNVNFESEDRDVVMKNLNTWLYAINSGLKVVEFDS